MDINFSSDLVIQKNKEFTNRKCYFIIVLVCLMSVTLYISTSNIVKTANFYEQKMRFKAVPYLDANEPRICLYRDTTEIILTKTNGQHVIPNRELYGYGYDANFIIKDQEKLQEKLLNNEFIIFLKTLKTPNI